MDNDETINRLRTFVLVDQILFHTEKSLRYVTFLGNGNMAEITQDNFRSLIPVKEASVIMKIKQDKKLTLKEA
ncbi:MAG: DUF3990 domain-containing protein [Treponema sp.]|nr:DUF3990 domain-containing protein [Treponema sp.]MBD5441752.1 DUF3990 domain-containing protein [Treponema sp.]